METHLGGSAVGAVAGRRLGNWHLLFADATIPGQDSGRLGYDQMRCLDALLSAEPVPTLLFLHQHPVPIGSAWMDTMGVSNTAELLALCRRHSHMRALVCGHIHQELDMDFGGVRVLGAPSTCVQFLPGSADFALDNLPPGYRELRLDQNGHFETWVERLDDYREPLDLGAGGY
jgi:3',5'-cyclic-AMP phosphodiesterase